MPKKKEELKIKIDRDEEIFTVKVKGGVPPYTITVTDAGTERASATVPPYPPPPPPDGD